MVCEKFSVAQQEVHGALLSGNPHDQLAIAYNLVVDNKRIEDETAKLEIKDFYVASSPPPLSSSLESPSRGHVHPERVPRARLMSSGGGQEREGRTACTAAAAAAGAAAAAAGGSKPPHKRAKWHLGIRSQSKPHDIMNEVYRAMKALDFVSILLLYFLRQTVLITFILLIKCVTFIVTCSCFVFISNLYVAISGVESGKPVPCSCASQESTQWSPCEDEFAVISG